ncbi:hypothetical protein F070042J6_10210 [Bacteroides sp. f07]
MVDVGTSKFKSSKKMKYICIKECYALDKQSLIPKQLFRVGQIYEFSEEPDRTFFKKVTT